MAEVAHNMAGIHATDILLRVEIPGLFCIIHGNSAVAVCGILQVCPPHPAPFARRKRVFWFHFRFVIVARRRNISISIFLCAVCFPGAEEDGFARTFLCSKWWCTRNRKQPKNYLLNTSTHTHTRAKEKRYSNLPGE